VIEAEPAVCLRPAATGPADLSWAEVELSWAEVELSWAEVVQKAACTALLYGLRAALWWW